MSSAVLSPEGSPPPQVVLAIDPGRAKCGIAIVRRRDTTKEISPAAEPSSRLHVLHREIAETKHVAARVSELAARYSPDAVLVGDATGSVAIRGEVQAALTSLPLYIVPEAYTSERARRRYLEENPPRGLLGRLLPPGLLGRLLPPGLRTPPCPYDDYVAVLLAEDFFGSPPAPQ